MSTFTFNFTITGINRRQAAQIMRVVLRLIEAFRTKPGAPEEISLGGGFTEIETEQEGATNE